MSDTRASLRRKIESAGDLQSVVRSMKAMAAASVGQYERSVLALGDYYRTVELGLGASFRKADLAMPTTQRKAANDAGDIDAIVFGSDQGLVGRFNDVVAEFAIKTLAALSGTPRVWAVGERVHARLADAGLSMRGLFPVPNSINGITPLVGQIQVASEARQSKGSDSRLYVFHNRPKPGALYDPVCQRLLPLDAEWHAGLVNVPWPTATLPEVLGNGMATVRALIREYLFISLFRACAESLASENASRLAAMQRAEKSIDDLLETVRSASRRLRQTTIDEELFDIISGFEALTANPHQQR